MVETGADQGVSAPDIRYRDVHNGIEREPIHVIASARSLRQLQSGGAQRKIGPGEIHPESKIFAEVASRAHVSRGAASPHKLLGRAIGEIRSATCAEQPCPVIARLHFPGGRFYFGVFLGIGGSGGGLWRLGSLLGLLSVDDPSRQQAEHRRADRCCADPQYVNRGSRSNDLHEPFKHSFSSRYRAWFADHSARYRKALVKERIHDSPAARANRWHDEVSILPSLMPTPPAKPPEGAEGAASKPWPRFPLPRPTDHCRSLCLF